MNLTFIVVISAVYLAYQPQLLPRDVVLTGPQATQRLVVLVMHAEAGSVADLTAEAVFRSSDTRVASVDAEGVVHAVADGQTEIDAELPDGRRVSTRVRIQGTASPSAWSFRNDVRAVMTKTGCNSGRCHGAAAGQNQFKLSLRGFDAELDYHALTRGEQSRRVSLLQPAQSLMLLKPTLSLPHGGGRRFDIESREYRILSEWLARGASPPQANDPRITRLEVHPLQARLEVGDQHRIVVRGFFSDGHSQDLTRWAMFTSSNPTVVRVGKHGQVTVLGPGESTISVGCLDQVAMTRITVPYSVDIASKVFDTAPRNNFIDDLVLRKLEEMRIPPSGICSDSEFLRRAFLDAAGILPTAEDARKFLANPSPGKRRRLIESLLERSEYVDFWAYKWSDLLLVSSAKLRSAGARAFHRWIRSSVESNKRWDQFVSEIVTASGSTIEQGAANYFLLHGDPRAVAENVTQTFLGQSIHCARCHNHPFDKWTQDDYYSVSSFFARVGRKDDLADGYADNSKALGETTIFLADRGEVIHPRRGRPLPPRPLEAEPVSMDRDADRRTAFTRWMTSGQNRYFVRTIVNRVWKHFMGRGLVEPVDDLRETNTASNEELMQALTGDFVAQGFNLKQLIRTIMNSATYQASAIPQNNAHDQQYYSHFLIRRLLAEVMVDIISQATGVPENFTGFPTGTRALQLPDSRIASYTLNVLGRPARELNSHHERIHHSTVTQVLHLVNGKFISRKLRDRRGTLQRLLETTGSNEDVVREIYWVSFARLPQPLEVSRLVSAIAQVTLAADDPEQQDRLRREAFEDFWAGLLMSKEFLFNH